MTPRQSLIAALEGGIPDTTPLTIYDWNMGAVTADELAEKMQQPAWRRLIEQGLTVRCHCPVVKAVEHGVEYEVEEKEVDGVVLRREIKTTPVGRIDKDDPRRLAPRRLDQEPGRLPGATVDRRTHRTDSPTTRPMPEPRRWSEIGEWSS